MIARLLPYLVLACLATPAAAQAPQADGFRPVIGAGVLYRPDYRGSDEHEATPIPYVGFRYGVGGMVLSGEGAGLKLDVLPGDNFAAGPIIKYGFGRSDVADPVISLLPEIDAGVDVGGFFEASSQAGRGRLSAGLQLASGVGDREGVSASLQAGYHFPISSRVRISLRSSITWADEQFMQTFYGIDAAGAVSSGLASFEAEPGLESAGLSAAVNYRLNEKWSATALASFDRLLNSAADSPIVSDRGSENQTSFGLTLSRAF